MLELKLKLGKAQDGFFKGRYNCHLSYFDSSGKHILTFASSYEEKLIEAIEKSLRRFLIATPNLMQEEIDAYFVKHPL